MKKAAPRWNSPERWLLIQPTKQAAALRIQRKPTEACHTNASSRKKKGMIGRMSTKGPKAW
jgi:hypothetical protein